MAVGYIWNWCNYIWNYIKSFFYFEHKNQSLNLKDIMLLILFIIISIGLFALFVILDYFAPLLKEKKISNKVVNINKKSKLIIFLVLMITYLAFYPGHLSYDGPGQIYLFKNSGKLDTHHPVLHTLLMVMFVNIGESIFNSVSIGYGFYTFLQVLIVAVALTIIFINMWRITNRLLLCICSFAIVLLNPVFLTLSVCSMHDIIFASFFALTVCYFILLIKDKNEFIKKKVML